jgi:hypothetical protein
MARRNFRITSSVAKEKDGKMGLNIKSGCQLLFGPIYTKLSPGDAAAL